MDKITLTMDGGEPFELKGFSCRCGDFIACLEPGTYPCYSCGTRTLVEVKDGMTGKEVIRNIGSLAQEFEARLKHGEDIVGFDEMGKMAAVLRRCELFLMAHYDG